MNVVLGFTTALLSEQQQEHVYWRTLGSCRKRRKQRTRCVCVSYPPRFQFVFSIIKVDYFLWAILNSLSLNIEYLYIDNLKVNF